MNLCQHRGEANCIVFESLAIDGCSVSPLSPSIPDEPMIKFALDPTELIARNAKAEAVCAPRTVHLEQYRETYPNLAARSSRADCIDKRNRRPTSRGTILHWSRSNESDRACFFANVSLLPQSACGLQANPIDWHRSPSRSPFQSASPFQPPSPFQPVRSRGIDNYRPLLTSSTEDLGDRSTDDRPPPQTIAGNTQRYNG